MKLIVFSILSILVSTYAVVVDKEEKGYLHDVLQINNVSTKCTEWCYHTKRSPCQLFPVAECPYGYDKISYERGPCWWPAKMTVCKKKYRCSCPTPAPTPSPTKCMKWCPVREVKSIFCNEPGFCPSGYRIISVSQCPQMGIRRKKIVCEKNIRCPC